MKKLILSGMIAAAACMFSGCASVEVAKGDDLSNMKLAPSGQTVSHINASNWGLYFLKWPMITGSVKSMGAVSFFDEDSVNIPKVTKVLTREAAKQGATEVLDVESTHTSQNIPIPFPFLFYMHSVDISGNAIK